MILVVVGLAITAASLVALAVLSLRVTVPGRPETTIRVVDASGMAPGTGLRIGTEFMVIRKVDGNTLTVVGAPQRVWRWQR